MKLSLLNRCIHRCHYRKHCYNRTTTRSSISSVVVVANNNNNTTKKLFSNHSRCTTTPHHCYHHHHHPTRTRNNIIVGSTSSFSSSSSSSSSSNNDSAANTTATNNSATTNSNNSNTKHHLHTHQSILHNIHPHQLYQIINNVNEYQNFLPYCHESKILQRSNCGSMYDAVLGVGLPFSLPSIPILSLGRKDNGGTKKSSLLEERYVSRVRMIAPSNYDTTARDTTDNIMEGKEEEGVMMWSVEAKSIQSQLFDSLKSRWQLTLLNNNNNSSTRDDDDDDNNSAKRHGNFNCGVHFEVEIGVSNPLISLTLDSVLEDVARRQVEAFESRCHEVPLFRQ